ncbi:MULTISPECIES: NUDIX domain-containing protein [unclassified Microbacterium]|uniref:NUDIX hydrolase n=1 Tax=unclassified Microbacterium TaxID=2609290 RepID=UPI000EA9FA36|nr:MULTISPECIES: NUDIX domain-containing protein [unclassified Microbacterium]MBT2485460.1 NUDIX domain-containing protein [Microbacterium sp. ISL-108]RKN68256.1 NUDIX domain-containing protein [Microbacterium sp. CGR2]
MRPDDESLPVAGTVVLLRDADPGFEVLLIRRPDRGSFASAWVFPGGKVEPADHRVGDQESEDARRAGIRETFEEVGLTVDEPVLLSQWHPPVGAPTRIRTWFFLAQAPEEDPTPAPDEVVDLAWVRPAEALARHAAGDWTLFPPTWVTLHRLARFVDADSALSSGGAAEFFHTRALEGEGGTTFEWKQGRLEAGSLPWRFIAG